MPAMGPFKFDANGGVFSNGETVYTHSGAAGWAATLGSLTEEPTWSGHTFIGWSETKTSSATYSMSTTLAGINQESFYLYAVWEALTPTISFNSNGGTFESDSTTTKSVQVDLSGTTALSSIIETPAKPSYKLAGWSTTNGGSVTYLPDATPTITEDITLYAVWELRDDIGIVQIYKSGPTISASGDTLTITN